jgi:hypothetical protein
MANRRPEQELIDTFVDAMHGHDHGELKIAVLHNKNCKSKSLADIEYTSEAGIRWVIEAKSHDSGDKHNTVHKIFGELLKETGRTNRVDCRHAILIPQDGLAFYSRAFQSIAREKFVGFGKLVPIETVFIFGSSGVSQFSWENLYDAHKPYR